MPDGQRPRQVARPAHTPALVGADALVTFALKADGSVDRAKTQAASPETDFSFDSQDLLLEPVRRR